MNQRTDWNNADLGALCDHIEQTHHRYLAEELPQLKLFVDKVSRVHGGNHPSLHEVKEVFTRLLDELHTHVEHEKASLFPMVREFAAAEAGSAPASISEAIRRTQSEHESFEEALSNLRRLTDEYALPADYCGSYRAMLIGLEALEVDMRNHFRLVDKILFPQIAARCSLAEASAERVQRLR